MRISTYIERFLLKISTADPQLISNRFVENRGRFVNIGGILLVLYVLTFLGFYNALGHIFSNETVVVFLGICISLMLMNIYRLCLITLNFCFGKLTLAGASSFSLRLVFIGFISFASIKSFEAMVFPVAANKALKDNLTKEFGTLKESTKLHADSTVKAIIKNHYGSILHSTTHTDKVLSKKILKVWEERGLRLARFEASSNANYFIKRVTSLNKVYPQVWLCTLLLMMVYLAPIFIKTLINANEGYYKRKTSVDSRIIEEHYNFFKNRYISIFKEKYNTVVTWEEKHLDPPFNTVVKPDTRKVGNENDFLKTIYNA